MKTHCVCTAPCPVLPRAAQAHELAEDGHQPFFSQTRLFLAACDPLQVRLALKLFIEVVHRFTQVLLMPCAFLQVTSPPALWPPPLCVPARRDGALALRRWVHPQVASRIGAAGQAITALQQAISKMAVHQTLTPLHADLLQLCLVAGCYHVGVQVLDQVPVVQIHAKDHCLEPVDFLRYFYYGGIVCTGLKLFPRAMECFRIAISMPAQGSHLVAGGGWLMTWSVGIAASSTVHRRQPSARLTRPSCSIACRAMLQPCPALPWIATRSWSWYP